MAISFVAHLKSKSMQQVVMSVNGRCHKQWRFLMMLQLVASALPGCKWKYFSFPAVFRDPKAIGFNQSLDRQNSDLYYLPSYMFLAAILIRIVWLAKGKSGSQRQGVCLQTKRLRIFPLCRIGSAMICCHISLKIFMQVSLVHQGEWMIKHGICYSLL